MGEKFKPLTPCLPRFQILIGTTGVTGVMIVEK